MNTQSSVYNLYYKQKKNTKLLQNFIKKFNLLMNNNLGQTTQSVSESIFIIDLALFLVKIGPITL